MAITRKELLNELMPGINALFDSVYTEFKRPYGGEHKTKAMTKVKTDAHKYKTEAGSLPIEVCRSMWLIKYGNEPINAVDTVDQDDLMWEIGNRLFWAGLLEHDTQTDRYTCKS